MGRLAGRMKCHLGGLRRGGRGAEKLGRRLGSGDERHHLGADRSKRAWPGLFNAPLKIAEALQLPLGLRQSRRVPANSSGAP